MQIFDDMATLNIPPVTQHLVTFLGACCETPLSGREIQQVFAQAMAFCASQNGDCSVYAVLLKFCVSQGIPEKALDVWKAIQKVTFLGSDLAQRSIEDAVNSATITFARILDFQFDETYRQKLSLLSYRYGPKTVFNLTLCMRHQELLVLPLSSMTILVIYIYMCVQYVALKGQRSMEKPRSYAYFTPLNIPPTNTACFLTS